MDTSGCGCFGRQQKWLLIAFVVHQKCWKLSIFVFDDYEPSHTWRTRLSINVYRISFMQIDLETAFRKSLSDWSANTPSTLTFVNVSRFDASEIKRNLKQLWSAEMAANNDDPLWAPEKKREERSVLGKKINAVKREEEFSHEPSITRHEVCNNCSTLEVFEVHKYLKGIGISLKINL